MHSHELKSLSLPDLDVTLFEQNLHMTATGFTDCPLKGCNLCVLGPTCPTDCGMVCNPFCDVFCAGLA